MATAAERGWGSPGTPGSPAAARYRKDHIVQIDVGGIRLAVRREAAPLFAGFIHDITTGGYDLARHADDWGYICRYVRGYEAQQILSNHAWGLAVDLNAQDHPMGRRGTGVPGWVVAAAKRWGLSWGGDYKNRPDEMHFEVLLSRDDTLALVKNLTNLTSAPQEDLLMAAAKDDHDARWALVLEWFVQFLGRPPASAQEHDLHVAVFDSKGAGACLSGIVNSQEAQELRRKRGW